jgi:hypothetical protein
LWGDVVAWAKIDDHYFSNPKVIEAGPEGRLLHLASIVYAAGNTSGNIPPSVLPLLAVHCGIKRIKPVVDKLVALGLWDPLPDDYPGWQIHDYTEFNPDKDDKDARKAAQSQANRENGRRGGLAKSVAREKENE